MSPDKQTHSDHISIFKALGLLRAHECFFNVSYVVQVLKNYASSEGSIPIALPPGEGGNDADLVRLVLGHLSSAIERVLRNGRLPEMDRGTLGATHTRAEGRAPCPRGKKMLGTRHI